MKGIAIIFAILAFALAGSVAEAGSASEPSDAAAVPTELGPAGPIINPPVWPPPPLPPCALIAYVIVIWEEDDDIAIRSAASEVAKRLVADERARIRQQVLNELGPLAFAVFDLGVGSRGAVRTGELEGESCIFQQLRAALTSSDAEVSGRAWDVLRP